jgi:hypothetical protein
MNIFIEKVIGNCPLCSDQHKTVLKMNIQNVNIIFKLIFPTNHVFDRQDRIVDCIDKSFLQNSLALIIRSFCIQYKNCSFIKSRENWRNVLNKFKTFLFSSRHLWKMVRKGFSLFFLKLSLVEQIIETLSRWWGKPFVLILKNNLKLKMLITQKR